MQGFLIGQLSVIIMICAFIKYFIFGDATPFSETQSERLRRKKSKPPRELRKKKSSVLRNPPPLTTATILSKTYYNVHSHQPESLDWFNVLIAQTIAQFRDDARTDDALLSSLDNVLNGAAKPDFLDKIKVTEISLGEDFPIFSNCRISPSVDEPGKLQARMDIDLSDVITLGVESKLLLNYPKPLVAVLPVGLAVSVVRFSGTVSLCSFSLPFPLSTLRKGPFFLVVICIAVAKDSTHMLNTNVKPSVIDFVYPIPGKFIQLYYLDFLPFGRL